MNLNCVWGAFWHRGRGRIPGVYLHLKDDRLVGGDGAVVSVVHCLRRMYRSRSIVSYHRKTANDDVRMAVAVAVGTLSRLTDDHGVGASCSCLGPYFGKDLGSDL